MTVRIIVAFLGLIASVACLTGAAFAHPCDNYEAVPLPYNYSDPDSVYPAEWNYGEITFIQYTPRNQMTNEEAYMIGGCLDPSNPDNRLALGTWWCLVMKYADAYYDKFGSIPPELTPEICASAMGVDITELPAGEMEQIISPVNGRYPRLNSNSFSAGDMYIHVLSNDEMNYFASIDDRYRQIWFEGQEYSPVEHQTRQVWFEPPVCYVRVYGHSGVIHNAITFDYVRATE
ncbi:hypothetical protein JW859_11605 [bacterium]|nr:hypothetical protein [bacterium]